MGFCVYYLYGRLRSSDIEPILSPDSALGTLVLWNFSDFRLISLILLPSPLDLQGETKAWEEEQVILQISVYINHYLFSLTFTCFAYKQ